MSGDSGRPARRPQRGKTGENEQTSTQNEVNVDSVMPAEEPAGFEAVAARTAPEPEPEVFNSQPLASPIASQGEEVQENNPEPIQEYVISLEAEATENEEEMEPLTPLPDEKRDESSPSRKTSFKIPSLGKKGSEESEKPKKKRKYSPKNKSLIIAGSVVGGIVLVLGYSLYQVSQAPSSTDIVAAYQEQSGDLGFPVDRGQGEATRFLSLYLTNPEDSNIKGEQEKLLKEMMSNSASTPTYASNVTQSVISGPTPAGLMIQTSPIEANQRYTAIVETTVSESQEGRGVNGEAFPDKVTKTVSQVTYRLNLRVNIDSGKVFIVGNPTLIPNSTLTPSEKTLPPAEAVDSALGSEINTSLMEPFFKAWGASDIPSINSLLASGTEGDWITGLGGVQGSISVTTVAPQSLKGGKNGVVQVNVEWQAANEDRQVSTYFVEVAFENSRWLVSNIK